MMQSRYFLRAPAGAAPTHALLADDPWKVGGKPWDDHCVIRDADGEEIMRFETRGEAYAALDMHKGIRARLTMEQRLAVLLAEGLDQEVFDRVLTDGQREEA